MMAERETDRLLGTLFKRNAPLVNEPALRERISARLWHRRRRRRRNRIARAVAVGLASVALVGAAAFGVYQAVSRSANQPGLVFTDLRPASADASAASETGNRPLLARVSPVTGTADLLRVESEGMIDPVTGTNGADRVRGRVEIYRLSTSQPAVSGTMEITFDITTRANGSADIEGRWILRDDQGSWEGSQWNGSRSANGTEQFCFGTASGTGGFEGLTLLLQWHVAKSAGSVAAGEQSSESIAVSGWIQSAK
jgi:hypothetical protein